MPAARDDILVRLDELSQEAAALRRALFEARAAEVGGGSRLEVLVLVAGGVALGVPVGAVREVVPVPWISAAPGAVEPVVGVVNYRGSLVPVLDIRGLLGAAAPPVTVNHFLAVLTAGGDSFAVVVDGPEDVAAFGAADLETAAPAHGASGFLVGVMRSGPRPIYVVDPGGLVSAAGLTGLRDVIAAAGDAP